MQICANLYQMCEQSCDHSIKKCFHLYLLLICVFCISSLSTRDGGENLLCHVLCFVAIHVSPHWLKSIFLCLTILLHICAFVGVKCYTSCIILLVSCFKTTYTLACSTAFCQVYLELYRNLKKKTQHQFGLFVKSLPTKLWCKSNWTSRYRNNVVLGPWWFQSLLSVMILPQVL